MTWTVRNIERDRGTITAIEAHDDRSAAILAGAYLEDRLITTIQAQLRSHPQSDRCRKRLNFSAKINLALSLGMCNKKMAQILHGIRKIRNEFGHNLDPITFNTPEIVLLSKRCLDVDSFRRFKEAAAEVENIPGLQDLVNAFAAMGNVANTPRNAYLNTVKPVFYS